jgi:triphosphoribosyl-dephospho-CoA synthase
MQADLPFPFDRPWKVAEAVSLALLLEASAPKAGNVHPTAAFHDMNFAHFAAGALAVGRGMEQAIREPDFTIGKLILDAVNAVKLAVSCNTNLGSILLFGPIVLACSSHGGCSRQNLAEVLNVLTAEDSRCVYQAIRAAQPGGLGQTTKHDVAEEAPEDLLEAMAQVASFDAVARQYTNAFEDVIDRALPWLYHELALASDVPDAVCRLQLRLLANEPDGLIVRKCGVDEALRVQKAAEHAWRDCQSMTGPVYDAASYRRFDALLRSKDNRLNPGTTADLIAAALLVALLVPLSNGR